METDDDTGENISYEFIDNENIEFQNKDTCIKLKYQINTGDGKTSLVIFSENNSSEFIILNKNHHSCLIGHPRNYDKILEALQKHDNNISWGWSNPLIVWKRQE